MSVAEKVRLQAREADDLAIISALVQDAAIRVADLGFDRAARRFALMMNRFRWEREARPKGLFRRRVPERVRSVLRFDHVDKAAVQGIDLAAGDHVLELLSLQLDQRGEDGADLLLVFAGGGMIRLELECVEAVLEDLTGAWPAKRRPSHPET
ncbi:MAG: DUF2948 family protein [Sphingomonadales bacterium]